MSFVVLLGVLFSGLSRSIEEFDPKTALSLNPLNEEARLNVLVDALNDGSELDQSLFGIAYTGLAITPVDARFYSLLAELKLRTGDEAQAHSLFQQAHRLSRTEIHALRYLIVASLEANDFAEAVAHMDVLLRRWPDQLEVVAPLLPRILSKDDAYAPTVEKMRQGTPWRSRVLADLARQEEGLNIAYRLLLDLAASSSPPEPREISAVTRGFVATKRYSEAYRLFRFMLPDVERPMMGFVHNSTFQPDSAANPFSWQYRNTRPAEITFSADAAFAGATVRFLNAPAKEIMLQQTLLLPPGQYRVVAEMDAASLRAPRSLFWRLRCTDPNRELVRLPVAEGTYRNQRMEALFVVDNCALQQIGLATDVIAESWQNRYSGHVRFHSIKIERIDFGETEG